MVEDLVPWVASVGHGVTMYLVGKGKWEGWAVGLLGQIPWIAVAVLYGAWGILLTTAVTLVIYTRNLLLWRKVEELKADAARKSTTKGLTNEEHEV